MELEIEIKKEEAKLREELQIREQSKRGMIEHKREEFEKLKNKWYKFHP